MGRPVRRLICNRRRPLRLVPALALLALAACSPAQPQARVAGPATVEQEGTAGARHPVSGLEIVTLTVSNGERHHSFRVEVAQTAQQQAHGLMYREKMGPDEGMLFPRTPPSPAAFWMKNTVLPLDIIFIGLDGKISNIVANAVPHSLDPRLSVGVAAAVLELNGGRAAELGIVPGDRVEWDGN